jgi:poly-gamma-glutamate capsule biosynthesis protein CapA/YwtB (metallophosphatase superfamily)
MKQLLSYMIVLFATLQTVSFIGGVIQETDIVNDSILQVSKEATQTASAISALIDERSERPIEILLVGDLMLGRNVRSVVNKYGSGDYRYLFANIKETLTSADIVFGNLEGPISNVGEDGGGRYSFRFSPTAIPAIKDAKFDVLSLANNHALDWGRDAICDSANRLMDKGIAPIGAGCNEKEANRPFIIEINGSRLAFMAFTEFGTWGAAEIDKPGLSKWDTDYISNRVRSIKDLNGADVVFVSLHWGDEYQSRSSKEQQALGQLLIDVGADVIVGHHPHVIQEIERYKNGWIIYSLGNFIFDQNFLEETMSGLMARVVVKNGEVLNIEPIRLELDEHFRPSVSD